MEELKKLVEKANSKNEAVDPKIMTLYMSDKYSDKIAKILGDLYIDQSLAKKPFPYTNHTLKVRVKRNEHSRIFDILDKNKIRFNISTDESV